MAASCGRSPLSEVGIEGLLADLKNNRMAMHRGFLLLTDEADGGTILARSGRSSDSVDVRIVFGLAAIAGWSLFGSEILNNADVPGSDRVNIELRMADLLAAIMELPEFGPGDVQNP